MSPSDFLNSIARFYYLVRAVGCRLFGWQYIGRASRSGVVRLLSDWKRYEELNSLPSLRIAPKSLYPVWNDFAGPAGDLADYFYQDLWAARKIYEQRPPRHVDIGSRVDGFIAHLLPFMPVEYVDIRPLDKPVPNLTVILTDATSLEAFANDSIVSLSTLNAAEHFGLGRYSDPIDPLGCFRFMSSLCRVLAPGGRLYFAVPLGPERLEFNAHRVLALRTVLAHFSSLKLISFSYVDSGGWLHEDVAPDVPADSDSCGLFEFTKESSP
jgi:hypothetical protein